MLRNLYIAAIEPNSGKSLVVLGILELLSKRGQKVGFFRPVIHAGDRPDNDIALVSRRYQLPYAYTEQYGSTDDQVRQWIAEGKIDELLKRIIEKYKAIERQCDFVVCEGVNPTDIDPALVDNFDTRVANHLSAPILMVANGYSKTPAEVVSAVFTEREAYLEAGCTIITTLVNRVAPQDINSVTEQLANLWADELVFVLPESEILAKPTIAEILRALNARLIYGHPDLFNREVMHVKVAAMQVPNFLEHIQEGSLIITPGDRADIELGCLATTFSDNYPTIAGIVLTGGLQLTPPMQTLLNGFTRWMVPILSVDIDTYETATKINAVRGEITPENDRKIAAALGIFEAYVDSDKLAERIAISRSDRMTPLMFEYELIERARSQNQHIILPESNDERILRAAEILLQRGVVDITLLGVEQVIREQSASLGLNLDGATILDPLRSPHYEDYAQTYYELRKHKGITPDFAHDMMHDISYFGTMMVYKDHADGMVSGALHTTAHTIRPALEFIRTQPGVSIVSSVFLMCLEDRVLVYGDCAVNPNPNPQ